MIRRIVSFLPSATELLYKLGAQDMLYGVTHECLFPEGARSKPRVIRSVFDPEGMTCREIDEAVRTLLREGRDVFALDEGNLADADPDLIIAQSTCKACAMHTDHTGRALQMLGMNPQLYSMDPHSIGGILDVVLDLSRLVGRELEGRDLKRLLESRIRRIRERKIRGRPKILALEWLDPMFTSGHWVPEMVDIAGGANLVSVPGERSRRMALDEAVASDPEVVVLMPCGFGTDRTITEYRSSLARDGSWNGIRAVRDGRVFAVDANSYFSKPGIRTVDGIEILAKMLHPEVFRDIEVPKDSYRAVG